MNENISRKLQVLVVDDEAPARQRLMDLLRKDPQIDALLEADDGTVAVDLIETMQPDIVFLDVQMPQLDGFGVIQLLGVKHMPPTVFVTAHDTHAVRAFDADAVDYLLKPYSDARFVVALSRVKARLARHEMLSLGGNVQEIISKRTIASGLWDRLVVKSGGLTRFVMVADIDWIEAADVYVNLHIHGKEILYRTALHQLGQRLDPSRFVRIHRSTIVNIERIAQLEPLTHGEFEVVLADGTTLHLSRKYRAELESRLGQSL